MCILYYSYGDAVRMRHMLKQGAEEHRTAPAQLECNMDSLNQMVRRQASLPLTLLPSLIHQWPHDTAEHRVEQ